MAVFNLSALRGEFEHAALRLIERVVFLKVTTAVFPMAAQNGGEEFRGNLVVLLIRRRRVNGDGAGFQLIDVPHQVSPLALRVAFIFFAETLGDKAPDPGPQHPIGQQIAFHQRF